MGETKITKNDTGPTMKPEITSVNKIIIEEKPPRTLNAIVEKTTQIGKNKETFITQKGGKMCPLFDVASKEFYLFQEMIQIRYYTTEGHCNRPCCYKRKKRCNQYRSS
jgi:hypothetical protein